MDFTDNFTDPLLTPMPKPSVPRKDAQEQVVQSANMALTAPPGVFESVPSVSRVCPVCVPAPPWMAT